MMVNNDYLRVIGYGSLVSEASARATCPDLKNFELFKLYGYRRIFGKINPQTILRDEANWNTKEVAACFIRPCETNTPMIVSGFLVHKKHVDNLMIRECDYDFQSVVIHDLKDREEMQATAFIGYDHEDDLLKSKGSKEDIYRHMPNYLKKYAGKNYRNDILPQQDYLRLCLQAYAGYGQDYLDNFINTSWLADCETSLSDYLNQVNWK